MATAETIGAYVNLAGPQRPLIPPLENGDRLTRDEFERRYNAMPPGTRAELIEGVVHMPSPVRFDKHGSQHFDLLGWIALYKFVTPGVGGADNTTVRLGDASEPQPDITLVILPEYGGRTRVAVDGYLQGAPELVAEVAASSASFDLHAKLNDYRRHGVREYLVWRVLDNAIDWFSLWDGQYVPLPPTDGAIRSVVFPGLWLDAGALVRQEMPRVLQVLQQGIESPEHAQFVDRLSRQRDAAIEAK